MDSACFLTGVYYLFLFFVKRGAGLVLLVFGAGDYSVDWKTYCTFANEVNGMIFDKCHLYANVSFSGQFLSHKDVSRLKW